MTMIMMMIMMLILRTPETMKTEKVTKVSSGKVRERERVCVKNKAQLTGTTAVAVSARL